MAPINGGNEGELMRLFFSLPVGASGRPGRRCEAGGGGAVHARRRCGRRKKKRAGAGPAERLSGLAGRVGRERWLGPAGRPRPGRRKQAGWAEKGCRAAGSAGPKVKKENQRISELKFDF
jgi:hypothetical protein